MNFDPEIAEDVLRGVYYEGHTYTYGQRLRRFGEVESKYLGTKLPVVDQLEKVVQKLLREPGTRQAIITIYDKEDQRGLGGKFRIPCSLTYQFLIRDGKLNLIYHMRSCDYYTHFKFDVALAILLLHYVARKLKVDRGYFTHFIGSFHVFRKDWEKAGVF